MKKRRFCAIWLALLLALPFSLFAVPAAAQTEGTRFLFAELTGESGASYPAGETAVLDLAADTVFSAPAAAVHYRGESNALCLTLLNRSSATVLSLTYEYFDTTPQSATVTHALHTDGNPQTIVLDTPHIDGVSALSLSFNATVGTVELRSLYNVSCYQNDFTEEAVVERCVYSAAAQTIEISGTLDYNANVGYKGEKLALFAIAPGEGMYLVNKTPVATMSVSVAFDFSIPVTYKEQLLFRYVVAVAVQSTGERIPLTKPIYPTVSTDAALPDFGYKGVYAADVDLVAESGAALAFADVYLDRMDGTQTDGMLYAGDHGYYYFDAAYMEELDLRVKTLSDSGARVCLRLLVSGAANGITFAAYTDGTVPVEGKALNVTSTEGLREVLAMADFLTARYNGGEHGRADAIALGRAVNETAVKNYTDAATLAAYVERYVTAFSLVWGAAVRNNPDVVMVLPVSDRKTLPILTDGAIAGNYPADLFLFSFCRALGEMHRTPPAVTVLVETAATPARLTETETEDYGADHVSDLGALIGSLRANYAFLRPRVWYEWRPDTTLPADDLCAAYALQYIALAGEETVETFTVDLAEGAFAAFDTLQYFVKNIDTDLCAVAAAPALRRLGVSSLGELFDEAQIAGLQKRRTFAFSMTAGGYADGATPIGSYDLWNFAASGGALGWYSAGGSVSVLSVEGVRTLHAAFDTGGGYGTITHEIENFAGFSFASRLAFTVGVRGTAGAPYEVRVQLIGKNGIVTAAAAVTGGEMQTLCLDLGEAAALADWQCIRISARPLAGGEAFSLAVQSVTLESTELDSAALAARISALSEQSEDADTGKGRHNLIAVIVTLLVIFVSIAVVVLLWTKHHVDATKKQ